MTNTASGYSPMARAPTVAMAIRKFSSKTCPFFMFRRAFQRISHPMIK
jgi:hypothetical protein